MKPVPLIQAAKDKRLLGGTLTWRQRQLEVLELFGDDALRLVVVAAGRQGGKSSMAVAAGIWNAAMRSDLDDLMPRGRTRFVLIAAPSESQSRELIRVAAAMVEASPVLRGTATVTADRVMFELGGGRSACLQALPANPRTVRGMTASMVIADECAHFNSEAAGWANDVRMIEALEGSMSVFDAVGKSKMALISTPAGQSGRFYELFAAIEGGVIADAAVVHCPAWELNPALDNEEWRESKRRLLGESSFAQEHGAEFTTTAGSFFPSLAEIEWDDAPYPPQDAHSWVCGLDPAYSNDHFGVCVVGESRSERGVLLVGDVHALEPQRLRSIVRRRAREDRVHERVLEILQPYVSHGLRIVSDQHQGDSIQSFFGGAGISTQIVTLTAPTQNRAFVSTRSRLLDGSLRCWRHEGLLEDMRRVRSRDSESLILPHYAGGHCDAVSALCLATWAHRHVTDVEHAAPRMGFSELEGAGEWVAHGGAARRGVGGRDPDQQQSSSPVPGWPGRRRESLRDMRF